LPATAEFLVTLYYMQQITHYLPQFAVVGSALSSFSHLLSSPA